MGTPATLDDIQETALLLPVAGSEPAVSQHRRRLDSAAADGIPAHVTVLYPFVPLDDLLEQDHHRLRTLFADEQPIAYVGLRTRWFGDRVLYVDLDDPEPVRRLIEDVAAAYPTHPPYGGEVPIEDVIPHLTIGHDRPSSELRTAEREVAAHLPLKDHLDRVELWSGPPLSGRTTPQPWQRICAYRLGSGASLER